MAKGFLSKGLSYLQRVREESLATVLTATLVRNGSDLGELDGLVFATSSELIDGTVVYLDVRRQDFICPIAIYQTLASGEPAADDQIVIEYSDGTEITFTLTAFGGQPVWEPHDPEGNTAYRLHSQIVEIA